MDDEIKTIISSGSTSQIAQWSNEREYRQEVLATRNSLYEKIIKEQPSLSKDPNAFNYSFRDSGKVKRVKINQEYSDYLSLVQAGFSGLKSWTEVNQSLRQCLQETASLKTNENKSSFSLRKFIYSSLSFWSSTSPELPSQSNDNKPPPDKELKF